MIKESFDFLINCHPLIKYSVKGSMVSQTCPTQRAPDWWESARFQAVSLAQAASVKAA